MPKTATIKLFKMLVTIDLLIYQAVLNDLSPV